MDTLTSFCSRACGCSVPVLVLLVFACGPVVAAAPNAQSEMAAFDQGRQSVVAEMVASAQQQYREANFEGALLRLARAKRLAPDDPTVRALTRECELKAARKREVVKGAPSDPASLKRFVDNKYQDGVNLFRRKDYAAATQAFETVWLVAGNYRDTWEYLPRLRSLQAAPGAAPTPGKTPTPVAVNVPQGAAEPSAPAAVTASPVEQAQKNVAEEQGRTQQEVEATLLRGKELLAARQWDGAQEAFNKVLQLDPKNRTARRSLEQIDSGRKDEADQLARQQLEQQQRDRESQIETALAQGDESLKAGQWDQAQAAFDKVLLLDPGNRKATSAVNKIRKGRETEAERARQGQETKAQEQLRLQAEQKERERQGQLDAALAQGKQLLEARQWDQAQAAFAKALEIDPKNRTANRSLSQIESERQAEAARATEQQEAKAREEARRLAEQQEQENQKRLEAERQKAATINEALRLAKGHLKDERFDAAAQSYKSIVALDPTNAEATAGLEDVNKARQAAAERAQRAQQELQAAQRMEKVKGDVAFANTQYKAGQYDKALETYRRVLKDDPENKAALKGLERVKAAQDAARAEAQRLEIERSEQQRRQAGESKCAAAKEQERSGRYDQALVVYKEVLGEDPENSTALKGVTRCNKAIESLRAAAEKPQTPATPTERRSLLAKAVGLFRSESSEQSAPPKPAVSPAVSAMPTAAPILPPAPEPTAVSAAAAAPIAAPQALQPVESAVAPPPQPPVSAPAAVPATAPSARPTLTVAPAVAPATAPSAAPAVSEGRRQAQAKYDEAQKLIEARQYERALAALNEALQFDGTFDPARQQARELQAIIGRVTARSAADQAAAAEAQKKTEEQRKADEQKKAQVAADEQKKQVEATVANLISEARALGVQQNWDEAEKKVKEALVLSPENAQAKAVATDIEKGRQKVATQDVKTRIAQATDLMAKGDYPAAVVVLEDVLKADPTNEDAQKQLRKAQARLQSQKEGETGKRDSTRRAQVDRLLSEGMDAYQKKDIQTAVQRWNEVLLIDPTNQKATTYLKETNAEYQEFLKQADAKKQQSEAEAAAAAKMEEKVTIEVKEGTKLGEFIKTLSFVTGINFVIVQGAEAQVVAKFEDKRLREILDTVLQPNGLVWKRAGDVVTIMPDLHTKVFSLAADSLLKVRRLYETNELQRILWGEPTPPIKGIELTFDERQSVVILTDTQRNIIKMADFIQQLRDKAPATLTTKIYTVRKDLSQSIKTLVDAILRAEREKSPYEQDAKVILSEDESGAYLIVKDTEENIRKVEELLRDPKFQANLEQAQLEVYTVNLTPRTVMTANDEQVKAFSANVVEVISAMLYHKDGEAAARQQGRRMWYDPNTLQLTLIDTPNNVKKVADFVEALPQLEPKMRSKIIFLDHAPAGDLANELERVLGIMPRGTAATAATGNETAFSLRVEDERTFRDLSVRLVRVDSTGGYGNTGMMGVYGSGLAGRSSTEGTAQFVVRTPTSQSSDLSIPQYRSEVFEEYEIYVEKVYPSLTPGEGRARIKVSVRPEVAGGGTIPPQATAPSGGQPAAPAGGPAAQPVSTLEITPFDDLGALLVRYQNPAEFNELQDWITKLDIAVLQVSIETKFVEVNETIAKEFSSDMTFLNVGKQGIVLDDSVLNMRFAQDIDQFTNGLEPPLEYLQNASLLKGVGVLNLITGGQSPVNYHLRFLEEEGLLNVISGPTVTVLNTQQATFQINRMPNYGALGGGGGYGGGYGVGGYGTTGGYPGGYGTTAGTGGYGGGVGYNYAALMGGQLVDMEVTPNATRKGQITMDINLSLTTDQYDVGQQVQQGILGQALQPYTIQNTPQQPQQIYRTLETSARVKDGGTIVLGGWTYERTRDATSGIPGLRSVPYIGRLIFGRNTRYSEKTNLLIFLTAKIVE